MSPARRLETSTLGERVTEALREMILMGEFRSGENVTHDDLAKRLGVSTMPVREALLRLTHEGFIESRQSRSFRILPTTRDDIQDVYWLHAILAGELTARACRLAGPGVVAELQDIQRSWEGLSAGQVEELERLNFQFHKTINRAANSPKVISMLRMTIRQIPERFYALVPTWKEMSEVGHRAVVEAIASGDQDRARRAAEEHVRQAGNLLIEHFNDQGYWAEPVSQPARAI